MAAEKTRLKRQLVSADHVVSAGLKQTIINFYSGQGVSV